MSIFDNLTVAQFKTQFPRFTPQYLSAITYASGTTYFKGNIVFYETKFYECKKDNVITVPTTVADWTEVEDSVLNYTQDSDILNAYAEAKVNFNEGLFSDSTVALMVFLYLAAHYLTIDFNNAIGANNLGIVSSKSVGSVSESYTIPQWINDDPALSVYSTTGYGLKYASLVRPYKIGNIMLFKGGVTIA